MTPYEWFALLGGLTVLGSLGLLIWKLTSR